LQDDWQAYQNKGRIEKYHTAGSKQATAVPPMYTGYLWGNIVQSIREQHFHDIHGKGGSTTSLDTGTLRVHPIVLKPPEITGAYCKF
jgi:hypothetical protein